MNKQMDEFMSRAGREGLTFDDVSLVTDFADFLPDEGDISSRLTRGIRLNIPFVSAAMDTVTEADMAIAMAMLGGIGIIHRNLEPKQQAKCVGTVKHHLHGLIRDPITFKITDTVERVLAIKRERGFSFSGFPIVDEKGRLRGILTSTDLKFVRDPAASVAEVMTTELITAPGDTGLQAAYDIMLRNRVGKLPLVADGRLVGLYSYTDTKTLVENVEPLYNRDDRYRLRAGAAIGTNDQERVEVLAGEDVDVVVVDTAHGHSRGVIEMVEWVKKHYPDIEVVAGNIGTAEAALALEKAGADAVKVGIGPGSICTTRVVAGVGIPQITAVYECARALEGRLPIISDGGIRHSGDVPKALAAGADAIMMGSVLAGTEESPGEKIIQQGRQYVIYRGMGSLAALRASSSSRERYGLDNALQDELVPQGIEGIVPYAGTVRKVLVQFCGGLRAALGYCGCRTIPELQTGARFVRVSLAGLREAHPHDVKITREAPNYRSYDG
jgi:IMP dehydrogenase